MAAIPFVEAKWFHVGRKGKIIRLFVIHDAETPETDSSAEGVAHYFTTTTRPASAHYVTDNNSSVQCVRDSDTAFGAAGANNDGLHFEQAGYAKQTAAEWLDAYGRAQQEQLGALLRSKSAEHGVPLRWLTVAQVADGSTKGLCTHADVSAAFPKVSTGHTDPGVNFPKDAALAIWLGQAPNPTHKDDDMEIFEPTTGPDKGTLWFRTGNVYEHILTPDLYHELVRNLPGRGLEKSTKIDNAVVWNFMKKST